MTLSEDTNKIWVTGLIKTLSFTLLHFYKNYYGIMSTVSKSCKLDFVS